MKKILTAFLALFLVLSLSACDKNTSEEDKTPLSFGVIKGPTGIGAAFLMEDYSEVYDITLASAPAELVSMVINGELDIACLPSNLAATLYNNMNGGIQVVALVTKGVLYVLENGESVNSVSDLSGKTIYATGQAANPEYILNYILSSNDLIPGEDVTIEWRDSDELATLMASGEADIGMLPEPAATSAAVKNEQLRYALDLSAEWDALSTGSGLYMTCVVVRSEVLENRQEAVGEFMERYIDSVTNMMEFMLPNGESNIDPGELLKSLDIVGSAEIGNLALPRSGLTCVVGEDMKPAIEKYFQVLFDADPSSIGGAVPGEDFYCKIDFVKK